ncbi:uncharacterized protein LOC112548329 [Alligator sinensis]|uniref:Uncharacterized protein LOC112548329 n=1 Tax=Alligator sinensis TaxID=38654 RepID=A0A3Q0FUW9_ALLSI|nr:uncharacterized protein LOC112548329 [Alligator sinensis]
MPSPAAPLPGASPRLPLSPASCKPSWTGTCRLSSPRARHPAWTRWQVRLGPLLLGLGAGGVPPGGAEVHGEGHGQTLLQPAPCFTGRKDSSPTLAPSSSSSLSQHLDQLVATQRHQLLLSIFVFAYIWGFGGHLHPRLSHSSFFQPVLPPRPLIVFVALRWALPESLWSVHNSTQLGHLHICSASTQSPLHQNPRKRRVGDHI